MGMPLNPSPVPYACPFRLLPPTGWTAVGDGDPRPKAILWCRDHRARGTLRLRLREEGYQVCLPHDRWDALSLLEDQEVQTLVTDDLEMIPTARWEWIGERAIRIHAIVFGWPSIANFDAILSAHAVIDAQHLEPWLQRDSQGEA